MLLRLRWWWRRHRRRWGTVYFMLAVLIVLAATRDYWGQGRIEKFFEGGTAPVVYEPTPHGPRYQRPKAAPNGSPWPVKSGYLAGYPRLNVGGVGQVSADNRGNTSDVFVKLVSINGKQTRVVRQAFVRGGEQFAMAGVSPGRYEILYQLLDTGELYRSAPFLVTIRQTPDGEQTVGRIVGLYGVIGGDTPRASIGEREFASGMAGP